MNLPRDAVPWAGDEPEELRDTEDKVVDLGNEEKEQRLGEVRLNANNSEGHAGQVAERVSRERACGVPTSCE